MWFEILPAFGIICAALLAPHLCAYGLNKLVVGNSFRRSMCEHTDRLQYLRDARLTGNPYKINGLDALPDPDACQ